MVNNEVSVTIPSTCVLDELLLEAKNLTNYPVMTSLLTSRLSSTHKCGKIASIVVRISAKSHIHSINIDKRKTHV